MWTIETVSDVSNHEIEDSLHNLSTNTTAALRIPGIYTGAEIDTIVENIGQQGVLWYPNFEFRQGRIGIGATEYASKINGKEAYFLLEPESSRIRDRIFPENLDPVARMAGVFSQAFDTSVAEEPSLDHAKYFTGLIRAMGEESTTHFDFAPHQLPGWRVADAVAQFAVVTYLQMPGSGGELTIYNRPWEQKDEAFNKDIDEKGPKGFGQQFLEDEESVTIMPSAGEMVVFNSRNFHKVESIVSEIVRYSINSFMSLSDDKLHLWN
ncbi:2OG-Fe(II) oxygenase [Candidatus Saccharibacteria bacterium]|nr:2OG-Fe(II) oxygenase [Candidatus Saccharibacteria bacterium]